MIGFNYNSAMVSICEIIILAMKNLVGIIAPVSKYLNALGITKC